MKLHEQIKNLPETMPMHWDSKVASDAYKVGHMHALRAAAELALKSDACIELLSTALLGLLSGCEYRSIGGDTPAWHAKSIPRVADLDRAREALATMAR